MYSQLNLITARLQNLVFCIVFVLSFVSFITPPQAKEKLLVFAAASTTAPLQEIANLFEKKTGHSVAISFAGSSVLARQLQAGAPAHLFLSANIEWVTYLQEKGFLAPNAGIPILSNRLVLISSEVEMKRNSVFALTDLPASLGRERLAIGDPEHVPAGIYAKQALTSLGIWNQVRGRLAPQNSVKNALFLVVRNESPYGIVYKTDAINEPKVSIVAEFPVHTHTSIKYMLARTHYFGSPIHRKFEDFLRSEEALAIFEQFGFSRSVN